MELELKIKAYIVEFLDLGWSSDWKQKMQRDLNLRSSSPSFSLFHEECKNGPQLLYGPAVCYEKNNWTIWTPESKLLPS